MFNFGTQELILVLVIALVVFGPGKLPDVGKAIGKSINEFKGAMTGEKAAEKQAEVVSTPSKKEDVKKIEALQVKPIKKTVKVEDAFQSDKKKEDTKENA